MTYALPSRHRVREGADGAYLELHLRTAGDEPYDLTGATSVTLTLRDELGNTVATRNLNVLNARAGIVLFSYQSGEVASRRRLFGTVTVTGATGTPSGWSGTWLTGWDGSGDGGGGGPNVNTVPHQGAIVIDVT